MSSTPHAEVRAEALGILAALARNPNRLEAIEQADDVLAVYRAVVGPPDAEVRAAYARVQEPARVVRVA
jgi:hypothetical protein